MLNKEIKKKRIGSSIKNQNAHEVKFSLGGYAIVQLYANQTEDETYGEIFASKKELKKAHPKHTVLEGYGIIELKTGNMPDDCLDWYFLYEETKEVLLNTILANFQLIGNYVFEFSCSKKEIEEFLKNRTLQVDSEKVVLGYFYHISTEADIKHRITISAIKNAQYGYELFFEGPNGGEFRKIDMAINDYQSLFSQAENVYTDMYF